MNAPDAVTSSNSRRGLAPTAIRAFSRLAGIWKLTGAQQARLLGLEETQLSTLYKWKSQPARANLSHDTLDRISYLIGIYKALHILLPDDDAADTWIHRSNDAPPFGGRSALARMLAGSMHDLFLVRAYLDAERG
ncbi:MAG: MbcA/ParS/Xre antitoxin family protein [Candidatus Tumulicola sp.]